MPKQYTNTLFSSESDKLEQKILLNLMSIDIESIGTVTTVAGNTLLYDVTDSSKFIVDDYIRLNGQPGVYKVVSIGATVVSLDKAPTISAPETKAKHVLTLVDSNYDVSYDGIDYLAFPLAYSPAAVGTDGTTETASITVSNVDRTVIFYVENDPNYFVGNRVEVKSVYASVLDNIYTADIAGNVTVSPNPEADSSAYLRESHRIDSYNANEQVIQFNLKPAMRVDVRLPRRRFLRGSCYFRFKDPNSCQYSGSGTTCKKTWDACVAYHNQEHFGGFPGVNSSRRIWL